MLRDDIARYTELSGNDGEHTPIGIIGAFLDGYETGLKDISKREWIPASERLPEKEGRYLCTVGAKYRKVREMYYAPQEWMGKSDKVTWRSIDGAYVYDWFIEAWQPLPSPYKSERGE